MIISRAVNSDERSRLTLQELLLSFLGCFLGGSGVAQSDDLRTIQWLSQLANILDEAVISNSDDANAIIKGEAESSWFNLLLSTARAYQHSQDDERRGARRLISLGRQHGKSFIGLPREPLFGFSKRGRFIKILMSEDEQIHRLREVAKKVQLVMGLKNHQFFIRYKHTCQYSSKEFYEYATALPLPRKSVKRNPDEFERQSLGHSRWLFAGNISTRNDKRDKYFQQVLLRIGKSSYQENLSAVDGIGGVYSWETTEHIQRGFEDRAESLRAAGETVYQRELEYIQLVSYTPFGIYWPTLYDINPEWYDSDFEKNPIYTLGYGDEGSAALFCQVHQPNLIDIAYPPNDEMKSMFKSFAEDKLNKNAVVQHLYRHLESGIPSVDPHLQSLKALSTVAMLYKDISSATVDVRVLQLSLYKTHWVREADKNLRARNYSRENPIFPPESQMDRASIFGRTPRTLLPYRLDRASSFSCIAMFESGLHDVHPDQLQNVMAMSSGDSIYTSVTLLCDPSENTFSHAITRVKGNIGRPGIACLVPPRDPRIIKVKISEWPNINRDDFDGKLKNSFHNTSLHLSFTGAQSGVNLEFSGAQDDDVYMLETLISVCDKGKWIADLDPLKIFSSSHLCFISPCEKSHNHSDTVDLCREMTSIDNWLELIDAPESLYSIVQAHGNWEARLAAASISEALKFKTLILPRKVCWKCFKGAAKELRYVLHDNHNAPNANFIVIA